MHASWDEGGRSSYVYRGIALFFTPALFSSYFALRVWGKKNSPYLLPIGHFFDRMKLHREGVSAGSSSLALFGQLSQLAVSNDG